MLPIGVIIKSIVTLIVITVVAVGFWWITGLRADLATSQANTEKLKSAVEAQQAAIEQMKVPPCRS